MIYEKEQTNLVTNPPKTGDAAGPWGFVVIGLAACAGYLVLRRRRG